MDIEKRSLGAVLGITQNIITKPIRARLRNEGITYPFDHIVLLMIVRFCKETVVQQDLAEKMGKDKSVILRIIDVLEQEGLLKRIVDSADRRKNILELTKKGIHLCDQVVEIEASISQEILSGLTGEEMDNFYRVINHIRANAEKL